MSADEPEDLEDVIDRLIEQTAGRVRVEDILETFDQRALGPVLLIPALLLLTPLGGVPGVPTTMGFILVLLAGQRLLGRDYPWVPRRLARRGVDHQRMQRALDKARPWARRIDSTLRPRLSIMLSLPMRYLNAAVVIVLGLLLIPLELVPFAGFLPAIAVLALGLGMIGRDGVFIAFGWIMALVSIGLVVWAL